MAQLVKTMLGYTFELNHALQKRDRDIVNVNAMQLIYSTNIQLQQMDKMIFLKMFIPFHTKHKVEVVDTDNLYRHVGRCTRFYVKIINILKCY